MVLQVNTTAAVHVAPATFSATRPDDTLHFSLAQRAIAALAALALFFGFGAILLQMCGMTAADVSLAGCALAGCAAIAACIVLAGRGQLELRGLAIMAAVVVVAAVALNGQVIDSLAATLNHLQATLDARTAVFGMPYLTQAGATPTLFCVLFSVVLGALCAQIALRGNVVVVALAAIAAVLPIVFGFVGASPWLVLLACGLAGCFVSNAAFLNQVNALRGVALGALAAAIVLGAVAGIAAALTFVSPLDGDQMRSGATQALEELRFGKATYAMPDGKIAAARALQTSDREALEVATDANVSVEYLRGFVGDVFANGSWEALDPESVTGSADLFYWLRDDGFNAQGQIAKASVATGFAESALQPWAITYEGARARFAYLPYGYAEGAQATFTTDFSRALRESSTSNVSFTADAGILWKAYKVQGAVAAVGDKPEEAVRYRADEQAYRAFVYDNYLSVPRSAADTFERLFGDSVKLTSEEAKALVASYFDNYVSYEEDPKEPQPGLDAVSNFLAGTQEGYSIHYATAAALMLRYYGVPARYVEGYQLNADDATGSYLYVLTEKDAHAWVEYYLDGVGWVVFDPTPGYGDESLYEKTENTTTSPLGSLFDQGSSSGATWVPEIAEEEPEPEPETDRGTLADFGPNWLLWLVIGLLAGLIVAFVVRAVILRRRHAQRLEELKGAGTPSSLAALFGYGVVLAQRGLHANFDNSPYASQVERAESAGLAEATLFARAAQINDRALFAPNADAATEDDVRVMCDFVEQAQAGTNAHASAWDKFLLKFVYCIM